MSVNIFRVITYEATYPASTTSSVTVVPLLVSTTYTSPPNPWGTTQLPDASGANWVPASPDVNAQNVLPSANAVGSDNVNVDPAVTVAAFTIFSDGNA
jgi:hypothetical protein